MAMQSRSDLMQAAAEFGPRPLIQSNSTLRLYDASRSISHETDVLLSTKAVPHVRAPLQRDSHSASSR